MKAISVVMTVYNEPLEWLEESIESILGQTHEDFEFIIVNDNPERSDIGGLLEEYAGRDERIRIIANEKNIGLTRSLNKAIEAAQGKYIARMDGDDVSLLERLRLQYEFLERNEDVFLVGGSVEIIDENGKVRHRAVKNGEHERIVEDMFGGRLAMYHPTIMFRNEGVLYREKFETAQDYDLYLTLLSANKRFGNLKDVVFRYRVSNRSVSMGKKKKQVLSGKLAMKFYYERLESGCDSYDKLDFTNERSLLEFVGISADELEAESLKKSIVFALGAGDIAAAREAFAGYKKHKTAKCDILVLRLFVTFPRLHGLYRKLRYEVLKF